MLCSETEKTLKTDRNRRNVKKEEQENTDRRNISILIWGSFHAAAREPRWSCWRDAFCMPILRGAQRAGIVGGIAIVSLILSILGIRAAAKGFRERERNYLTCKIGLPGSALVLLLFLVIFIGGLR